MGQNLKNQIQNALKVANDNGIILKFDCIDNNGNFTKLYACTCMVDNELLITDMQSWDSSDYQEFFIPCLKAYANKEIPLSDFNADFSVCDSWTTEDINGNEHGHYAKDSYKWGKADIMWELRKFEENFYKKNDLKFDASLTGNDFNFAEEKYHQFFKSYFEKLNGCNGNMNGWKANRYKDFYITSKILPAFIKEQVKGYISEMDMRKIQSRYMAYTEDKNSYSMNDFKDDLNRLIDNYNGVNHEEIGL